MKIVVGSHFCLSFIFHKENEKTKSSGRAGVGTSEYNSDSIFDSYNAEDEERDTCFVLAALTESKETLKMLVRHHKRFNLLFSNEIHPQKKTFVI